MLVLTRKAGEAIRISNNTVVTMLGTKNNQIKIGITAPKNIAVHREEICNRIKQNKKVDLQSCG